MSITPDLLASCAERPRVLLISSVARAAFVGPTRRRRRRGSRRWCARRSQQMSGARPIMHSRTGHGKPPRGPTHRSGGALPAAGCIGPASRCDAGLCPALRTSSLNLPAMKRILALATLLTVLLPLTSDRVSAVVPRLARALGMLPDLAVIFPVQRRQRNRRHRRNPVATRRSGFVGRQCAVG